MLCSRLLLTETEVESSSLRQCNICISIRCCAMLTQSRLFQPTKINDIESFQNGELKHNNSIDLALWKCRKIWSHSANSNVILSLETDSNEKTKSSKTPHFRHVFNDDFISRLCRSFMSSLDDERVWRDFQNRLNENVRADYFRFNIIIHEEETRIDDVKQMKMLKSCVELQSHDRDDRIKMTSALLATSFYFELNSLSILEAGTYTCLEHIRCRNDSKAVINFMIDLYDPRIEFCTDTSTLEMLNHDDVCNACHLYRKRVMIFVRHLKDVVIINIKYDVSARRKISGFPHNMLWFIQQQELDASFDKRDHDVSNQLKCQLCTPRSRRTSERKRKINQIDDPRKRLRERR